MSNWLGAPASAADLAKPTGRERDLDYMLWVKTLDCVLTTTAFVTVAMLNAPRPFPPAALQCWGEIEANHLGVRPLGRKSDDRECGPFCTFHHDAWSRHLGVFYGWTRAQRRQFADDVIVATQELRAGVVR